MSYANRSHQSKFDDNKNSLNDKEQVDDKNTGKIKCVFILLLQRSYMNQLIAKYHFSLTVLIDILFAFQNIAHVYIEI